MEALQDKPLAFSSRNDLVSASSRSPLITKDGTLLNIELFDANTSEDSPILLLTHGVCESAETLGVQAIVTEAKNRSVKVAVLELEGHGYSSGRKCVCGDFDRLLDHFLEFVQHAVPLLRRAQSNAPFVVSGFSLGGALSIYAAEEISKIRDAYPSNFKGLAPIAPAIGIDNRAVPSAPIVQCLKLLSYIAPGAQIPLTPWEDPTHYNCPSDSKRNFTGHWPLSTTKMLLDITSTKVYKDRKDGKLLLNQVDNVLIIAGRKDQIVPIESISSFHEEIQPKKKSFVKVPNSGHDLVSQPTSSKLVTLSLYDWISSLK